ncbi:1-deoxy-D-xylulose-5-phosphate reductoisomerase [Haematobacter genomosp. 1]|uniref:1-deoxy-D-xylulose 5-phosphate reductoisomerase n=1 Tax=Haematobacter genomosp. 1 TaxID=366618 RepID=A0A212AD07_9RHOB|nr:1-deoxy-D-xylulose-5-phosphate reductoisomerase [Haematobacter genomosp. 1]OWJ78858.1 1-deoxy-D-xylulose-5-phosphate reductoisomerase [Haematobacter genomosp. 1]
MRRVTVFGSTGSIGESTLDLLSREQDVQAVALTGGRNVARLAEQARALRAELAVTAFEECLPDLRAALDGSGIEAAAGSAALLEAADRPADWVMSAIVGAAGLAPGLRALGQGRVLALANKESLVSAGPLLLGKAARHGATVLPVDSEHSAIFQALRGEDPATVERVVITASGGPFRTWSHEALARATPAEAGRHPNWDMGQRITIDSASLFNKAMEIIETREFFGFSPAQIEVVVHPQSAVHALVGFIDGALMAHLGAPDMRHAIGHAMHWPERRPLPVERLDLARLGRLDFEAPDEVRFPALRLAREVMGAGGLAGAVFTAAKETALDHFIAGRIGFLDMAGVVEESLTRLAARPDFGRPADDLDAVLAMDDLARRTAGEIAAMRGLTTTGA